MKNKLAIISLIIFLLATVLTGTALAQTVKVGVNPGNTFDYSYKIYWSSTNPAATVPAEDLKLNDTQYIRLDIVSVEGTLINVDFFRHFNDGTETKQNGNIDVNTQVLEIPYSTLIIRADANPDEKVYPFGGHATLNDTATRTYPIGQIDTIRYVSPDSAGANSERTEIFYNRANGVGVEYNFVSQETSGSYVTTIRETLLISSWVIPEFPVTTVLMIILLAIPILLIAHKRKRVSNHKFAVLLKK